MDKDTYSQQAESPQEPMKPKQTRRKAEGQAREGLMAPADEPSRMARPLTEASLG